MPQEPPVLFGGIPKIPSPDVFENARKNNPAWHQILESGYALFAARPENAGIYADPTKKGATLEQCWLVFTLFAMEPFCLLARQVPKEQIGRITHVVPYSPPELVQQLIRLSESTDALNVPTLHYDGKTGHSIRLTAHDKRRDRFIYHDPWPERSLLCKENNLAGVDAQPEGKRWSVTSRELERVIFASFVFPSDWARLQGVQFDLLFDQWRESEFFKFFHLKQTDQRSENQMTRRMLTAGPFNDKVTLIVDHKEDGKIVKASLLLDRSWMAGNLLLALDISKSFVAACAPRPDKEVYDEMGRTLWSIRHSKFIETMKNRDPSESNIVECVHAFIGATEAGTMITDFATLSFRNVAYQDERIHEIEYTLM